MFNKTGQSTVEYILLVTAVIMVVVVFTNGPGSVFQKRLTTVLNQTTNTMEQASNKVLGGF